MAEEKKSVIGDFSTSLADSDLAEAARSNDIQQVRDLLFGEYNREYDRHFRNVDRQIELMGGNIQRLIEHTERIEREKMELQDRFREYQLRAQMQVEDLQRAFQERLREQRREFDAKMDGLLITVHQMVDGLDERKLEQEQLADMFMDMGMRIKRSLQKSTQFPRLADEAEDDEK